MAGADYIYCSICNQKALYHEDDCPDGLMVICATCAHLHVAVPVADIQEWIVAAADCKAAKQWPSRGVASEYRFPWMDTDTTVTRLQPIDDWLRSLIPTEATR